MNKKTYVIKDEEWVIEYITNNEIITETYRKEWEKAPRKDINTIIKNSVCSILLHPQEHKVLLAYRKTCDRIIFPWSWIDWVESAIETIKREIEEETWYIDIKSIEEFTNPISKNYYHIPKNINIKGTDQVCIVILNTLRQIDIDVSELEKHDMKRIDIDKVYNEISSPFHKLFRYRYLNKDRPLTEVDTEFLNLQQKNISK